jgi:hypothetical protein
MSASRDGRALALEGAVIGTLAVWLGATLLSQHPNRVFDRIRARDRFGLVIPNWRFFAPEPARQDMHLLHRVLTADGEQSVWSETNRISERSWRQTVWFPERRRDKALFDLSSQLLPMLGSAELDLPAVPAYRVLREFVEAEVRREHTGGACPRGFQFVLARGSGYDESGAPEYLLVSPFHPMEDGGRTGGASGEPGGTR